MSNQADHKQEQRQTSGLAINSQARKWCSMIGGAAMKTAAGALVAGVIVAGTNAHAQEPVTLTAEQMDTVTAGAFPWDYRYWDPYHYPAWTQHVAARSPLLGVSSFDPNAGNYYQQFQNIYSVYRMLVP